MSRRKSKRTRTAEVLTLEEQAEELRHQLTPKEFLFCTTLLREGCSIVTAFRKHYKSSNKPGKTPAGISKAYNADLSNARKILTNPVVSQFMDVSRKLAFSEAVLTVEEKRIKLAEAFRTLWEDLTDASGSPDFKKIRKLPVSIVKSIKETFGRNGITREVEIVSPLDVLRLDNELSGHNKPIVHDASPELVEALFKAIKPSTGLEKEEEAQ